VQRIQLDTLGQRLRFGSATLLNQRGQCLAVIAEALTRRGRALLALEPTGIAVTLPNFCADVF
jgi:hypothetical protein